MKPFFALAAVFALLLKAQDADPKQRVRTARDLGRQGLSKPNESIAALAPYISDPDLGCLLYTSPSPRD